MKAMYKYELAEAAGVSANTFRRWLNENTQNLARFGVKKRSQMLPPKAVDWVCREYGIDLWVKAEKQKKHLLKTQRRFPIY